MSRIKVKGILSGAIALPFEAESEAAIDIAKRAIIRVIYGSPKLEYRIHRRSTDARRRDRIKFVYTVLAYSEEEFYCNREKLEAEGMKPYLDETPQISIGSEKTNFRPLIVGAGPCGLFAALTLAEQGYRPIVIDRGDTVEKRVAQINSFNSGGALDTDSNIMFGAGGAGTFSDGKLVTRINDPLVSEVVKKLNKSGAPDDILYKAKPHVGTDILREVVGNIISEIEALGGEVVFRCRLDSLTEKNDSVVAHTSQGDIEASAVILAVGHSARDTYAYLCKSGFAVEPKSFSVGVRIEHLCEDIDRAMYGDFAGDERLGHAEYTLADTKSGRGVYTFCMCPGGEVVAASSERGGLVVNGMSHHARSGKNSNCAVAVSVFPSDYGSTPEAAIEFQREIEKKAFKAGGGDYSAPIETVGDFMSGKRSGFTEPFKIMPTYTGLGTRLCDISGLFHGFINEELRRGLPIFDRRIPGFAAPDALMTGVETRTSAPVRILRGEDRTALGHPLIYPCGEGAGYAGGITSAAVDGMRSAIMYMSRFDRS